MNLNIASDWPLTDDYLAVFKGKMSDVGMPKRTAVFLIAEPDEADGPVLVLGAPEGFEGSSYVRAPSVRATIGTAGGATKLEHALRLIAHPTDQVPMIRVRAPQPWRNETVVVDIEVSGDVEQDEPEDTELLSVAVARRNPAGIEVQVFDRVLLDSKAGRRHLVRLLRNNILIAHNGKFDFRWLNRHLADELKGALLYPNEDTILMHHLLYPGAGEHGLKPLAHRFFGAPDWEAGIKKYTKGRKGHFEFIPNDILIEYNAWDVYWTMLLFERLSDLIKGTPQERCYRSHTLPASRMLQDVEQYGMPVDEEYLAYLDTELSHKASQYLAALCAVVGNDTFNPRSVPQLQKAFAELGWRLKSTNEATMQSLKLESTDETLLYFIDTLLEYRSVSKSLSTYVKGIWKKVRNGYVHSSFLLHGTVTGRLSSRGPNLQNITNEEDGRLSIRRICKAPQGYKMVGADYAQAELRTMAELCGDPLMISNLQRDSPDFFDNMLPHVFPDIGFVSMSTGARKPYRLKLKRVVYGSSYGLTCHSISNMLTLSGTPTTKQEAADIQNGYLGLYPKLQEWREETLPKVLEGDELVTPFGRRFQQDVVTDGYINRIQNQAWAFRPQSTASDICVSAAITIHDIYKSRPEMDAHICALVHDAIYSIVKEEYAEEAAKIVATEMEASAARVFNRVPFLTDTKIGDTWNEV